MFDYSESADDTMNKMGFGFLRIPQNADESFDWDKLNLLVDAYLSKGGNYFDTCYTYLDGNSELGIRKCLVDRVDRASFQLTDKLPGYRCKSYRDCKRYFKEQLNRCGVDYFDVYMLHWLNRKHYQIAEKVDEFRFLRELKEKGLAKRIGFSYHDSASLLDEILTAHPEVDVILLQINYLDWETAGIESRKCYEVCLHHGKSVMVMEPVKGGTLANVPSEALTLMQSKHPDWTPANWAIRFAQSLPGVEIVLSGMNELSQVEDNMQSVEPLCDDDLDVLAKVREIIERNTAVPCTGCRYCETHCPKHIPIPDYFKMLNEISRFPEDGWKLKPSYESLSDRRAKASECLSCKSCEAHCPQHIFIAQTMRKVAVTFE